MLLSLDRKYKGHYIHPNADQDPETKMWTLRVLISWEENGKLYYRTLYGSPDQFDNLPDAIKFGTEYAVSWIDGAESNRRTHPPRNAKLIGCLRLEPFRIVPGSATGTHLRRRLLHNSPARPSNSRGSCRMTVVNVETFGSWALTEQLPEDEFRLEEFKDDYRLRVLRTLEERAKEGKTNLRLLQRRGPGTLSTCWQR